MQEKGKFDPKGNGSPQPCNLIHKKKGMLG